MHLLCQIRDPALRPLEAPVAADDSHVAAHDAADLVPVVRDDDLLVRRHGVAVFPVQSTAGRNPGVFELRAQDVLGRERAEGDALEKAVGCHAICPVEAGEGHLANSV